MEWSGLYARLKVLAGRADGGREMSVSTRREQLFRLCCEGEEVRTVRLFHRICHCTRSRCMKLTDEDLSWQYVASFSRTPAPSG